MRIGIIGLGSIAKRHIRNVTDVLTQKRERFQIDVFRHSEQTIEDVDIQALVSNVYSMDQITDKYYDICFITNPTSKHYETIKKCVPHTKHMFIEKPVFEQFDKDIARLHLNQGSIYYVACPLRYTLAMQYIKNNINIKDVISARAISSSYLPEWRPGMDYRNTYSAQKSLGGGVAIDLIHEWDYLIDLFGMPEKVLYAGGKFSKLDIDSDDLAVYMGIYDDRIVEVHLDYFGRKAMRELLLYTVDDIIRADLLQGKISYLKCGDTIDLSETRNSYQCRELEHFFDIIDGKIENDSSIEHAVEVLKIAENQGEI